MGNIGSYSMTTLPRTLKHLKRRFSIVEGLARKQNRRWPSGTTSIDCPLRSMFKKLRVANGV